MNDKKVILIICDGLGFRKEKNHNAIATANTPTLDFCFGNYPFALLAASGEAIGLPEGQMGTSEANHLVMGSGRVIYQNLVKINRAIKNDELIKNEAILEAFEHVKKYQSILHIKGIVSDGGVHGHLSHIKALIKAAKENGVKNIFLHLFTDGRDVPPQSAIDYIKDLEEFIKIEGIGKIASIGGRYWGMDRDDNRERIEKHFLVMVKGEGRRFKNAVEAIEHNYSQGVTDEFIEPALVETGVGELGCIQANDAVIFSNFRADRARQISKRIIDEKIDNLKFITMTKYDEEIEARVAFPPESIKNTLSEILSKNNLRQLKITETEKFSHLTFFFNAQRYEPEPGEERILIPSNKDIATHDAKPEMKVFEIAGKIEEVFKSGDFDFIVTNLTNCDMVGHTGNFDAIVKAVEAVDRALEKIVKAAKNYGYDIIITADHGNAEETFDEENGQPITAHTLNPVPFVLISDKHGKIDRNKGDLSDIAPTILDIFGLEIPKEMTGRSLIK